MKRLSDCLILLRFLCFAHSAFRSRDSAVNETIRQLWTSQPRYSDSSPGSARDLFSSPACSDRFCDPLSILFKGYLRSSTEIKSARAWSCPLTSVYWRGWDSVELHLHSAVRLMSCTDTTVPFPCVRFGDPPRFMTFFLEMFLVFIPARNSDSDVCNCVDYCAIKKLQSVGLAPETGTMRLAAVLLLKDSAD